MSKIKSFEEMKVWKDAVRVAVEIYRLSGRPPLVSDFAARDQVRRSAVSISNNIAEGFEYNDNVQFVRFLRYSKGSAGELRSNLCVLKEASLISTDDYEALRSDLIAVSNELEGLIKYLQKFESNKIPR